jgi:hypothetical protein
MTKSQAGVAGGTSRSNKLKAEIESNQEFIETRYEKGWTANALKVATGLSLWRVRQVIIKYNKRMGQAGNKRDYL